MMGQVNYQLMQVSQGLNDGNLTAAAASYGGSHNATSVSSSSGSIGSSSGGVLEQVAVTSSGAKVNTGIVVYILWVIFMGILLTNLLIARMLKRVNAQTKAQWGFLMVRQ